MTSGSAAPRAPGGGLAWHQGWDVALAMAGGDSGAVTSRREQTAARQGRALGHKNTPGAAAAAAAPVSAPESSALPVSARCGPGTAGLRDTGCGPGAGRGRALLSAMAWGEESRGKPWLGWAVSCASGGSLQGVAAGGNPCFFFFFL